MIKNVEIFFDERSKGAKTMNFVFSCGSSYFSASQHPQTPPNLQKKCI